MCFIWILFGSILLFFENFECKNNTIFPIGYLSQCELPQAIMTGQTQSVYNTIEIILLILGT